MEYNDIEKALAEQIMELKPAPELSVASLPFEVLTLDYTEKDNVKWHSLLKDKIKTAKNFEIHCWNEECEWIELALKYGVLKEDDWKYGKIITGAVTAEFTEMLLNLPKPSDTEIYNKMTPFFNVFLDDTFQSCHYGTENYYKLVNSTKNSKC